MGLDNVSHTTNSSWDSTSDFKLVLSTLTKFEDSYSQVIQTTKPLRLGPVR